MWLTTSRTVLVLVLDIVQFGVKHKVDFIAVQRASDVTDLRKIFGG